MSANMQEETNNSKECAKMFEINIQIFEKNNKNICRISAREGYPQEEYVYESLGELGRRLTRYTALHCPKEARRPGEER